MSEVDDSTVLRPTEARAFDAEISDGWGIGGVPNGGYLAYYLARALAEVLTHPDPLTVTARYARPTKPGPARIECEVIKRGRTQSAGVAKLLQDGKERCRVTATFGDLAAMTGPTRLQAVPPPMPPAAQLPARVGAPEGSSFADRVEIRFAPGTAPFLDGGQGPMGLGGWIRFADDHPIDVFALLVLADAFPPPVFNGLDYRVWVPTVELTIHIRRRPTPGWIKGWFRTRFLIDGRLEEDGELWDAEDRLVALCRQYALLSS